MARNRSAHLSRDRWLGENWLSPRPVRRCWRITPLPCDLRGTTRSLVREQKFYRFAVWWKFAARAPHRIALAYRGHDPKTIPAPALQYEKRSPFIFFLTNCLPRRSSHRSGANSCAQPGIGAHRDSGRRHQSLVAAVPCHWLDLDGRRGSFDCRRGSLCQTARTRALVSRSCNSVRDWRNRIRIVCMAIPSSRSLTEVLSDAAHR